MAWNSIQSLVEARHGIRMSVDAARESVKRSLNTGGIWYSQLDNMLAQIMEFTTEPKLGCKGINNLDSQFSRLARQLDS